MIRSNKRGEGKRDQKKENVTEKIEEFIESTSC